MKTEQTGRLGHLSQEKLAAHDANTRPRCRYTQLCRTATITPRMNLNGIDEFEGLTVIHHFGESDPQSLLDPTHLFVHGEGLDV